ncbi:hypothetical protein EBE87_25900 [Pseudoroseomonas wenyumeiae]|uniref:Uncharacterized protein n=1 Tax=Teichococcus wenyumeiae TaxID=2478470 RepID=A0A3A9JI58_9PROT|nr:hypothetical protein D6Z83_15280 [Pseudoroseomonas wenyumeiae]RMI15423.1 hypothetical protein EBE87_25900 [Pseudoroseomonas wenyumeiae]
MDPARASKRCQAKTRSGGECQGPAMPNGRCRMHGGMSTGPRTAEGMARMRAARTIHGKYSREMRELRALIRDLKEDQRAILEKV